MRNLKKVLSLSLALVMLLGMMVVGAGAVTLDDFNDKSGINENYLEAVDLLTAINVLSGSQGNFDPTGTLTREQAAKIVATLALGVDAAEALSTAVAPFSDVAANWWSAGYVAYCANMGIVSGIGGGKFAPAGEVSGYQFAKMLLGVLGYGVNDEYVGANWVLNVSRDAQTVGVSYKVSISDAPLTREQAAQMAYNTLTLPLVSYSTLIGTYTQYAWGPNSQQGQQTLLGTLANNIFEVARNPQVPDETFGYNYENWYRLRTREVITDNYLTDVVLGTVTGGKRGAMYRSYMWNDRYTVIENGVELPSVESSTLRNSDVNVTDYNGTVWTLIDRHDGNGNYNIKDGKVDTIIVVTDYLAEVTKVNAATATAGASVDVKVYVPNGLNSYTVSAKVETEESFAKGDYVLIAPLMRLDAVKTAVDADLKVAFGANALRIEAAEVVSASTVTAYYLNTRKSGAPTTDPVQTNGSVTTGGKKYNYNGVFADQDALGYAFASGIGDTYTLNKGTYNFYLDKAGNVIGVTIAENAIRDFAYIIAVGEDAFKQDNIVSVLLSNGTVGTYTVSSLSGLNYSNADGAGAIGTAGSDYANVFGTNDKIAADRNNGYKGTGIYDSTANTTLMDSTVGGTTLAGADSLGAEGVGHIYSYSLDAQGNIVLSALNTNSYFNVLKATTSGTAAIVKYVKGYSTISYKDSRGNNRAAFADENTVFLYYNNGAVSMFTGVNNAPSIGVTDTTPKRASIVVRRSASGIDTAALVVVADAPEATLTNNYVNVISGVKGYGFRTDNGAPVYYYDAIKDGAKTTIAVDRDTVGVGVYMYSFTADVFAGDQANNVESGVYGLSTNGINSNNYQAKATVLTVSGGVVIAVADTQELQYIVSPETRITQITPLQTGATVEPGDEIAVVFGKQGNTNIARDIYITKKAVGGGATPATPGEAVKPSGTVNAPALEVNVKVPAGTTSTSTVVRDAALTALRNAGYTIISSNTSSYMGNACWAIYVEKDGVRQTFNTVEKTYTVVTVAMADGSVGTPAASSVEVENIASGGDGVTVKVTGIAKTASSVAASSDATAVTVTVDSTKLASDGEVILTIKSNATTAKPEIAKVTVTVALPALDDGKVTATAANADSVKTATVTDSGSTGTAIVYSNATAADLLKVFTVTGGTAALYSDGTCKTQVAADAALTSGDYWLQAVVSGYQPRAYRITVTAAAAPVATVPTSNGSVALNANDTVLTKSYAAAFGKDLDKAEDLAAIKTLLDIETATNDQAKLIASGNILMAGFTKTGTSTEYTLTIRSGTTTVYTETATLSTSGVGVFTVTLDCGESVGTNGTIVSGYWDVPTSLGTYTNGHGLRAGSYTWEVTHTSGSVVAGFGSFTLSRG